MNVQCRQRTISPMALALALTLFALPGVALAQNEGAAEDGPADQAIADHINRELATDQGVAAHRIEVRVTDGVVTMRGMVNNILAKRRAVRIARAVRGVRSVINNITVSPSMRSDKQVRKDVEAALVMGPAAESWEIEVAVDDGAVTLRGTVDSWAERRLAAKIVRGVRGVQAVENKLTIQFEEDRTDAEIKREIAAALEWDVHVDDALIEVAVEDGAVTLSGVVGSAAEKNQAVTDAYVAGVQSVEAGELAVKPWAADDRLRGDKFVDRSDEAIAEAVSDALLYDPRVAGFKVDVAVENGVATLRGTVGTLFAKRVATRDARNTVGVWRVKNYLKVRGEQPPTDEQIRSNVVDAIQRDPYVQRDDVSVSVIGGEVYLAGEVDTYFQKTQADDIASQVPGVVEVNNNLLVADAWTPPTPSPYVDEHVWLPGAGRYVLPEGFDPAKSDWAIAQDIRDELWWSPFVDAEQITVSVDDGVARLTGKVETWDERQAAATNAFEGGAVEVDNDLQIVYGPEYYQADKEKEDQQQG